MIGSALVKSATTAAAPWFELVKPFWPLIWRALVAAAIFWAGWHYGGREAEDDLADFKRDQAEATGTAVAQLRAEVAERDVRLTKLEAEGDQKLRDLEADFASRPPRTVRVCGPTGNRAVPSVSATPRADAADRGGHGELSGGAGLDIGPGLDRLVYRADRLAQKCLNQQSRSDALAAEVPVKTVVR